MGSRLVFLRSQLTRRRAPLSCLFPPHLPPPHYHLPSPLLHPSPPLLSLLATSIPVRHFSKHGSVNLVLSDDSKPRFKTLEADPPKKDKWLTKKRLKMQRKREKRKRNDANKRDPRRIRPKGKKTTRNRFPTAEDRIKYKIEKAKMKEAMLVERLKRYEVPKLQGPMPKPDNLTGEERFYMKKMSQKGSNYVPVGRRGVFGGVILNMHLHWKKHETVKVICKPCKPGQVQEYARDIARLSGGIPIQIIGDDTIIFYRGKNYVQPEEMSPIDTLSKKKALEKSKYEQSLETVRRFLAISEKELELYYRHVALYGDPASRDSILPSDDRGKVTCKLETRTLESKEKEKACSINDDISTDLSDTEDDSDDDKLSSAEVEHNLEFTEGETDSENEELEFTGETDSENKELSEPEVDSEDEEQYVIGVQVHQPK